MVSRRTLVVLGVLNLAACLVMAPLLYLNLVPGDEPPTQPAALIDASTTKPAARIITSDKAVVERLVKEGTLSRDYVQAVEVLECTRDQYPWSLKEVGNGLREWRLVVSAGPQDRFEISDTRATEGLLHVTHWTSDPPADPKEARLVSVWGMNPKPPAWCDGPFIDVAFAAATVIANAETMRVTRAVDKMQTAVDAVCDEAQVGPSTELRDSLMKQFEQKKLPGEILLDDPPGPDRFHVYSKAGRVEGRWTLVVVSPTEASVSGGTHDTVADKMRHPKIATGAYPSRTILDLKGSTPEACLAALAKSVADWHATYKK